MNRPVAQMAIVAEAACLNAVPKLQRFKVHTGMQIKIQSALEHGAGPHRAKLRLSRLVRP